MNQLTASLWGDEGWAVNLAVKPIPQIIKIVSRDTSPPLYYLWEHVWLKLFGTSEIAIRSLSLFFFLLTVLVVYLIGQHLWNKKTGLLAALLTLTSPFLFTYAFEGRMYSLLVLTSTLSIYFFIKKHQLGFILATAAALYTHHFAIFVVVWEGIWTLWKRRKLTPFFIIGLLYLPWLYPLYYQTSLVGGGFWLGKPSPKDLINTIEKFLIGSHDKSLYQTIALLGFGCLLALRQWRKNIEKSLFLIGWFLVPLLLTFAVSQFFQSIFYDRYLLLVIPAAAVLFASQTKKFTWPLILIVAGCLLTVNYHYFFHPVKRPFRQLAEFIKTEAPNLTLINHNAASHHLWESKYYGLEAPIYSPQPLPFYTGTALMAESDVIDQLPDKPLIGVISSAPVEEVQLPGYHLNQYHQIESLKFIWMAKN